MEIIDWRELYASNRAVIDAHLARAGVDAGAPAGSATLTRPALPPPPRPARAPQGRPAGRLGEGWTLRFDLHVPASIDPAVAAPLVVALHGCTQTAATFAAGCRLNDVADRHGFVVAYPEQGRDANPQGCWNWFTAAHQQRGAGEPALLAATTRKVLAERERFTVDERRVFVAGMSAGGAMASVMAATYPDLFAAVAVHSGLAYGCARNLPAATQAMRQGGPDPRAGGAAALAAMGAEARAMPAIVVHGTADAIVAQVNGDDVVRQWMETNRLAAAGRYDADFARPDTTVREHPVGGRPFTRRRWTDRDGRLVQEQLVVDGLGHAWSGGARGGSYTDPRGPSAAEAIWAFFAAVSR